MSLLPGDVIELDVEKPAAGGRMIGRHEGQVVLVLGAIPGERVRARVDSSEKRLAFASALEPLRPSPDRRDPPGDPLCGGCLFSHIAYPRQVLLKAEIIADAFTRIGHIALPAPVSVAPSPEQGYRMRARFHVAGEEAGFFREGSHTLCGAAQTGQVRRETVTAVESVLRGLRAAAVDPRAIEVTENIAADERAVHVEIARGTGDLEAALDAAQSAAAVNGATARTPTGELVSVGDPVVSDPLSVLTGDRAVEGRLSRSPESFFQANRYLLPALVRRVLDAVPADGEIVDLYAGVGLFSIPLGATGRSGITAVEGDRASAADLKRNAIPWRGVRPHVGRVEDYLSRRRSQPARTIIVDPPRTGISRDAMQAIARHGAATIVYVSCDPPTMARDARRLLDAGYRIETLQGFDLFPNTPHVETVGIFVC